MTGQSSLFNVCKSSKMKDLDAILVYIIQKYIRFSTNFFDKKYYFSCPFVVLWFE